MPVPIRLLVVGSGHASLPLLAHASEQVRRGVAVTLLSDCPELWYSGMTPEWLGGVYARHDVTVDLGALCDREGIRFVTDRAVSIDRARRSVATAGGDRLGYDLLVIDVGSVNPHDEEAGPAIRTKPLHRVEALGAFLRETADGTEKRRLAIVGGGAAGVEVALNVTARPELRGRLDVVLLEPGPVLLSRMPTNVGAWATARLRQRGAAVRFGVQATAVDAGGVQLAGNEIVPADAVLWATGSAGSLFLGASGLSTTGGGFVRVASSLQSKDDARVFVAGDAAAVEGYEDLPRIGVHAVKQGPTLRENVDRALEAVRAGKGSAGLDLQPFRPYPVAPLILSTGEPTAWFVAGALAVRSGAALALKHAVDRRWIHAYRSGKGPTYEEWWDLRAACGTPVPLDSI